MGEKAIICWQKHNAHDIVLLIIIYTIYAGYDIVTPLDPVITERLKQQLEISRKHIMTRYASFVSCLCDSIEEAGVTVPRLRTFILNLPAFKEHHGELKVFGEIDCEIKKACKINDIFDVLSSKYASYLNYEIFQSILEKFFCY